MNKIGVICTSKGWREFTRAIQVEDRAVFRQLSNLDHVRGTELSAVIRVGAYWTIPNIMDLEDQALTRVRGLKN